MYYELNIGAAKRFIDSNSDLSGGLEIVDYSVNYSECGSSPLQHYNNTGCNLGVLNSVQELEEEALFVYPNPSQGQITIQSDEDISLVTVLDAIGRLIKSEIGWANMMNLDLTELPHGVYQLQIESESGTAVKQVVLF